MEGDIFIRTETTDHGITTRYESVIGFGTCRIAEDEQEIKHGLKVLTEHYGYRDYSLDRRRAPEYLWRKGGDNRRPNDKENAAA